MGIIRKNDNDEVREYRIICRIMFRISYNRV